MSNLQSEETQNAFAEDPDIGPVRYMSTEEFQEQAAEAVKRAAYKRERVVVRRGKKRVAVLIAWDEYKWFCRWEDLMDSKAAEEALAEMKASGEKPIPFEEYLRELELRREQSAK